MRQFRLKMQVCCGMIFDDTQGKTQVSARSEERELFSAFGNALRNCCRFDHFFSFGILLQRPCAFKNFEHDCSDHSDNSQYYDFQYH